MDLWVRRSCSWDLRVPPYGNVTVLVWKEIYLNSSPQHHSWPKKPKTYLLNFHSVPAIVRGRSCDHWGPWDHSCHQEAGTLMGRGDYSRYKLEWVMQSAMQACLRKRSPEEGTVRLTPCFSALSLDPFPGPCIHPSPAGLSWYRGIELLVSQPCLLSVIRAWLEGAEMPAGKAVVGRSGTVEGCWHRPGCWDFSDNLASRTAGVLLSVWPPCRTAEHWRACQL